MIKESSNPEQSKNNFMKFPKGLCCGDDTQLECKHTFAIPTGLTLKSFNVKNLYNDDMNVILSPSHIEIEEALISAGYILDGPSVLISESSLDLFGSIKDITITLSDDSVVYPVSKCTKTIVCDFVAPYTGGETVIELNGSTYTIPAAGSPVYGTSTVGDVKAAFDSVIAPATVTVSDNVSLSIWEVTVSGPKNTTFSIGGTESDKCNCKHEYI